MDLVTDWISQISETSKNTVNMQRTALLWAFDIYQHPGSAEARSKLKSISQSSILREADLDNPVTHRSRPSGRMIPQADMDLLTNVLNNMGLWGARSQWFLLAGVASGARPVEWPDAEWIDKKEGVLRIYTAKVKLRNAWHNVPPLTFTAEDLDNETNKPLFAAEEDTQRVSSMAAWYERDFYRRTCMLRLTENEQAELEAARYLNGVKLFRDVVIEEKYRTFVSLHMDSVKLVVEQYRAASVEQAALETEAIFSKIYYDKVGHCIWRACKKAFPTGLLYALVDTRSTFAANRRAANGLSSSARELGHNLTTSRQFYAPASRAWGMYRQKPSPEAKQERLLADSQAESASAPVKSTAVGDKS